MLETDWDRDRYFKLNISHPNAHDTVEFVKSILEPVEDKLVELALLLTLLLLLLLSLLLSLLILMKILSDCVCTNDVDPIPMALGTDKFKPFEFIGETQLEPTEETESILFILLRACAK